VLAEVPMTIRTSQLSRALLEDLRVDLKQNETFDHLELSTHVVLEKNVRLIMDRIDELLTCVARLVSVYLLGIFVQLLSGVLSIGS
jgi:hypothetical protein